MKTEEYFGKFAELQNRALVDVLKKLSDIAISPSINFDPSLQVYEDCEGDTCGVRYHVNDDYSYSVGIVVREGDKESCIPFNREQALSYAADIIAFAMHLEEMNDPNI